MGDTPGTLDEITGGGTIVTKNRTPLPAVLDVLIVGAGPAGTAAAFRAKELGLKALVIDRDCVLAILRDWISPDGNVENDKKVDSSYGPGGRKVAFPAGDSLVSELIYGDQVPAGELYRKWTRIYYENDIAARVGHDLVGLKRKDDEILEARCIYQQTRQEVVLATRSVILALGRGVPHKIEIPGDTTGVNYKMRDPKVFLGGPACVIGGGMSAAESVIAISKAKAAGGDETDVFWSYRRRSLPKLASTIAEQFFLAYTANGNIRYLPFSQPLAVLKHSEGAEFIALRSDRREMAGRPAECTYLEFPKERVLACIGADIPVDFLKEIGIQMLKSADTDEEFMAISPVYESQVPDVYMIGDLLAPAFLRTTDFSEDAVQSTVIDHTGNFKQGMLDGVLAVEAIRKRRDGASSDQVAKHLDERRAEFDRIHKKRLEAPPEAKTGAVSSVSVKPAAQVGAKFGRLALAGDAWEEKEERFFTPGRFVVGKTQGDISFPDDDAISDNHFAIEVEPDACYVSTEGMSGACWIDVKAERRVEVGSTILAGDQTLRIKSLDSLEVIDTSKPAGKDVINRLFIRPEGVNTYGRSQITPEAEDKRISRRHFTLQVQGDVITLRDFGSRNGTLIPVIGTIRLNAGDEVCFGNEKRLKFKGLATAVAAPAAPPVPAPEAKALPVKPPAEKAAPRAPEPVKPKAPPEKVPAAAPGGAPSVTIVNPEAATTFPIGAEEPLLTKLTSLGLSTKHREEIGGKCQNLWRCGEGTCGLCIVKVKDGAANLSKATAKEQRTVRNTVEDLNNYQNRGLEPGDCRLACLCKVAGPVKLELLGNTDAAG